MRKPKPNPESVRRIRCAIYTRKSTEEGLEQEFNSLDAQREAAEAYIKSQANEGWTCLPERYDDGGFTGGNTDRPGLQQLLADIAAGKVDCVVVYKVDRLSRSLMDFARIMETFEKNRISFVSVTQQFNTTHSMGRLTLNILLSFAQFEREIIGERIRDKLAAQRRKGKWTGGYPILGFDVDQSGPSPRLVVNGQEAGRVRKIFSLYLELGSILAVVADLHRRGWHNKSWKTKAGKTKGGNPFDRSSLHKLLTNPLYVGKIRYKKEIHDGEHEAIVDAGVFRDVQEQLHHHIRTGAHHLRNRYGALLRGLLYCKACGRTMIHNFTSKGDKHYRYYVCSSVLKNGRWKCPTGSLPAGEIERVVVEQISRIADDRTLQREVLRQAQVHHDAEIAALDVERKELERELARHHAEIRKLATSRSPTSATAGRIADLHEKIRAGEERHREIAGTLAELRTERIEESDVVAAFTKFDSVWNALSKREQADVMALLLSRVEFDADASAVAVSFHTGDFKALAQPTEETAA